MWSFAAALSWIGIGYIVGLGFNFYCSLKVFKAHDEEVAAHKELIETLEQVIETLEQRIETLGQRITGLTS